MKKDSDNVMVVVTHDLRTRIKIQSAKLGMTMRKYLDSIVPKEDA